MLTKLSKHSLFFIKHPYLLHLNIKTNKLVINKINTDKLISKTNRYYFFNNNQGKYDVNKDYYAILGLNKSANAL